MQSGRGDCGGRTGDVNDSVRKTEYKAKYGEEAECKAAKAGGRITPSNQAKQ